MTGLCHWFRYSDLRGRYQRCTIRGTGLGYWFHLVLLYSNKPNECWEGTSPISQRAHGLADGLQASTCLAKPLSLSLSLLFLVHYRGRCHLGLIGVESQKRVSKFCCDAAAVWSAAGCWSYQDLPDNGLDTHQGQSQLRLSKTQTSPSCIAMSKLIMSKEMALPSSLCEDVWCTGQPRQQTFGVYRALIVRPSVRKSTTLRNDKEWCRFGENLRASECAYVSS